MYKDNQFSYYLQPISNTKPDADWIIADAANIIGNDTLKGIIEEIRKHPDDKEARDKIKESSLPYVTFAGTFTKRCNAGIKQRSGYIVLDLDHLGEMGCNLQAVKQAILDEFTPALMLISPSGDGLKVICRIDTAGKHRAYFYAFEAYFLQQFSLVLDPSGKEISRACYLGYDPDVFMSDSPTVFGLEFIKQYASNVNEGTEPQQTDYQAQPPNTDYERLYQNGVKWLKNTKRIEFVPGSRHNYITELAGWLNRWGIDKSYALGRLLELHTGFETSEITHIVDGMYKETKWYGKAREKKGWGAFYTSFKMELLWVPRDQFKQRLLDILAGNYEHTTGQPPTSLKTSYIEDCLKGKIEPELLLLIAAAKSVIGKAHYRRTTREFVFNRMFGANPWHEFTRHYFDKWMDKAIERGFLVKIPLYRRICISISLSVDELKSKLLEDEKNNYERKQRAKGEAKSAGKEITELHKKLGQKTIKKLEGVF